MKIAIFHHLPDGGAKITAFQQIKYLSAKNQTHLYGFFSDEGEYDIRNLVSKSFLFPQEVAITQKHGIKRLKEDLKSHFILKKIHKEIATQIDKRKYDVVLIHPSRLTQAPFLLRFLKTPSLYYCHEPLRVAYEPKLQLKEDISFIKLSYESINRLIRKRIDHINTRSATRLVTNSNYTKDYILRAYNRSSEVCYPGVDTKVFYPSHRKKRHGILFVGDKTSLKGFNLVKESINLIPKINRPTLQIVSPKSLSAFSINTKKLVNYYSQAQVTLCLSVSEPFGLVALESMACETPVIAVKEGGYIETIADNKTGFLVTRNPRLIAEKIKYILKNPSKLRKIGKQARIHVRKNFSWTKHTKKLEKILLKTARHET